MRNAIYRLVKVKSRDEWSEYAQNGDILRNVGTLLQSDNERPAPEWSNFGAQTHRVTQGGQIFRPLGLRVGNHLLCKHNQRNNERIYPDPSCQPIALSELGWS